ncbi:hypothetical protein L1987_30954 [Smallanthus sonchifolius]|uniref:Uncharacterized protein n=1 Tax=Smallanthus sonchifolius TaxID=185202 RepID=A0ACB9I5R3_9ASTR|nr:hypothetical protein L1987_30954 [Smallanthus sonchifolius]
MIPDPPDPNTDGKFWQSEGSEDEGSNDDGKTDLIRQRSRQKGRDKPSNHLDGTMETTMCRYGLRSAGANAGISNQSTNGMSASMHKWGKESRHPIGKENIPGWVNQVTVSEFETNENSRSEPLLVDMDTTLSMQEENHKISVALDVTMQSYESMHVNIADGAINSGRNNLMSEEYGLVEGGVMMNMEYAGDSKLNGLSCGDTHEASQNAEEEGDQEVSSDQSTKLKSFVSGNLSLEVPEMNFNLPETVVVEDNAGTTIYMTAWESIAREPAAIIWPEVWSDNTQMDIENLAWKETIQTVKAKWEEWDQSKSVNLYKPEDFPPLTHAKEQGNSLFDEHDKIVEYVEKNACPKEEYLQRKKIKKNKRGGRFKQSKLIQGDGVEGNGSIGDGAGMSNRVRHKVKTSRNRQHELKRSSQSAVFQQEFIPKMLYTQTMGFNEFRMGHAKENAASTAGKAIKLKSRAVWNIYNELAAREARLKEIFTNINKTEDNTMLVNSILNMSRQRVTKFSAKVNEDGGVSIDENMIENEAENVIDDTTMGTTLGVSYANMLTGAANKGVYQEKIQFYLPTITKEGIKMAFIDQKYIIQAKEEFKNVLYGYFIGSDPSIKFVSGLGGEDDGFTVVTRRKGGNRPPGSGKGPEVTVSQGKGASIGVQHTQENMNESQGNKQMGQNSGVQIEEVHLGDMDVDPSISVKANPTKSRNSSTSVVKTTNRFILLDEEGNELEEGNNSCCMGSAYITRQENVNPMESVDLAKEGESEKEGTTEFMILDNGQHLNNSNVEGYHMGNMQSRRESGLAEEELNNPNGV